MPEIDIITRIMDSKIGVNLISIILGLGLASLFRKVCRNKDCVIIKGPELSSIKDKIFKYDDKCYKYEPVATTCKK
tara:strand:- start:457 stop:684 length:228 start_codon:yes stop_codon:yes gene_type:complete